MRSRPNSVAHPTLLVLASFLASSCGDSDALAPDTSPDASADTTVDASSDAAPDTIAPDADGADADGADADGADTNTVDTGTTDGSGDAVDTGELPTTIGGDRPARVVLPAEYDPSRPWPLILLLHGYGASSNLQALYWRLYAEADERGFILVLPEGTPDSEGRQFWDAWPACCNFEDVDVDDVAYLGGLLDEAAALYNVDPDRVYSVGHSNGGYMSYRLACDLGDRLAGIMSLAGAMPGLTSQCEDNGRVAVLQVHGTEDDSVPYESSALRTGAYDSAAFWAARNGCDPEPEQGARMNLVVGDEEETLPTVWANCANAVELWTLEGVGHIPAFDGGWSDAWLDWLLARSRQ